MTIYIICNRNYPSVHERRLSYNEILLVFDFENELFKEKNGFHLVHYVKRWCSVSDFPFGFLPFNTYKNGITRFLLDKRWYPIQNSPLLSSFCSFCFATNTTLSELLILLLLCEHIYNVLFNQ